MRLRTAAALSALLTSLLLLGSCGGGSSGPPPPPPISVNLSPSSPQTIDQLQTVNVTATVANDSSGRGVTWSLTGPGSLSGQSSTSVTYNGTTVTNGQTATVNATSIAYSTKNASLSITVNALPQITTFNSLPNGTVGSAYSQTLAESGGTPPFTWSLLAGAVPAGLSFNTTTAAVTGTPTGGGTWYFAPQLTDATGYSVNGVGSPQWLSLTVLPVAPPGNPVPFVSQSLVPDAVAPGAAGFTLTVHGAGFVSGATVDFNGAPLQTTFVSNVLLTATVPATDIASTGTASITVVNPTPAGGRSNAIYFPVAPPETTVSFTNASGSPIPVASNLVTVADFNGDGKPDLAVTSTPSSALTILLGNGGGTFNQAPGSPVTIPNPPFALRFLPNPVALVVGDFFNNGNPGLAVVDAENSNVAIFRGNGDGTFVPSPASVFTVGLAPSSLAVGDFTGDGSLDLAVTATGGQAFAFLAGFGDGAFTYLSVPSPSVVSPNHVAMGDFNGDGKLDLAYADITLTLSNDMDILLGNGDGTFNQAPGSPFAIAGGLLVTAGDFNGDGKTDLAIADGSNYTVTILLGNGDGTFTEAPGPPITLENMPTSMAVGDFNADGKLDLAVSMTPLDESMPGSIDILLGNGDGTFTEATGFPFAVGADPTSIAVGDFNGSGRLGLAVTNSIDGTISILLQN
jgi:FG-GAP-like repeat/Putative Ig domain/FG-GAP repeat